MNSYKVLSTLGSGMLEIDALHLRADFNGSSIEPPSIAHEIHIWLTNDLRSNDIPADAIREARLAINLEITRVTASKSQRSFYIGKDGEPRKGEFFKLSAQCKSTITTDEASYGSEKIHLEQWPVLWPDA